MTFHTKWREWPPSIVACVLALLALWWVNSLFLPLVLVLVILGSVFIVGRQGFAAAQAGVPRRQQGNRRGR